MAPQAFRDVEPGIRALVQGEIEKKFKGKTYNPELVERLSTDLVKGILNRLTDERFQPFKYLANCIVLGQASVDVESVSRPRWDQATDGAITEKWSNESLECIVTVWGLKY
jgi:dynein light chain Tctex-type 1